MSKLKEFEFEFIDDNESLDTFLILAHSQESAWQLAKEFYPNQYLGLLTETPT